MLAIIMSIENESDKTFVENIYITYRKRMYLDMLGIVRNKPDAEDCVHDMIEKIIDNLDKFKDAYEKNYFIKLLSLCCRNMAINKYNANKNRRQMEYSTTVYRDEDDANFTIMDIPDVEADVERIVLSECNCEYIKSLIDQLPLIYRDVLTLKGMDYETEEIARLLDISPDLVRKRYSRARAKLIEMGGDQLYGR